MRSSSRLETRSVSIEKPDIRTQTYPCQIRLILFLQCWRRPYTAPKDKHSNYYLVESDYLSLLQDTVPSENFIAFDLPGKEEISFSRTDLHLSDIGNKRLFEILATKLENRLKSRTQEKAIDMITKGN